MATTWDSKTGDLDDGHLENASQPKEIAGYNVPDSDSEILSAWSLQEQARIVRKVDFRLIPICGLMYCVSLLDRTNLSNAAIAGYVIFHSS